MICSISLTGGSGKDGGHDIGVCAGWPGVHLWGVDPTMAEITIVTSSMGNGTFVGEDIRLEWNTALNFLGADDTYSWSAQLRNGRVDRFRK